MSASSDFKAGDVNDPAKLLALLERINDDPSFVDSLPEDELDKIQHLVSPFGTVVPVTKGNSKSDDDVPHVCLSFTNLRQEYMKKLMITGLVAYLYRRADEYGRAYRDTVTFMDDMSATEEQVIKNQARQAELDQAIITSLRERNELESVVTRDTAQELINRNEYTANKTRMTKEQIHTMRDFANELNRNIDKLRLLNKSIDNMNSELDALQGFGKRFIIRQFLDDQFRFNPDKHVRSSYASMKKTGDKAPAAAKFIPPDDTFHNFQYYVDSNYEELRSVAEEIYRLKPDLEVGIIPYGEFATLREANDFVEQNKTATIADIRTLKVGKWNFIEAFKANRDRIEAYRGTIVEDILKQVKDDTKIGAQLTMDRATRRRKENIRETGTDPKAVREYIANRGMADVTATGNELSEEEQVRIHTAAQEEKKSSEAALLEAVEREEPAPRDTLRVNVYKMTNGGANTEKSHFFTKAVAPDPNVKPVISS
jgi:hypothetical protein